MMYPPQQAMATRAPILALGGWPQHGITSCSPSSDCCRVLITSKGCVNTAATYRYRPEEGERVYAITKRSECQLASPEYTCTGGHYNGDRAEVVTDRASSCSGDKCVLKGQCHISARQPPAMVRGNEIVN